MLNTYLVNEWEATSLFHRAAHSPLDLCNTPGICTEQGSEEAVQEILMEDGEQAKT